jgi:hypothetical protein
MPPFVPFIGVAALALPGPAAAHAAAAVYGGSTRAGDAIVVDANRAGTKLRSVVIAWEAACASGMTLTHSDMLRAAPASPSAVGLPVLGMTRNRNGRFAGKQRDVGTLDGASVQATVTLRGRLSRTGASGTLAAQVVIRNASGAAQDACRTPATRWSAARAAGRVYGGNTSQREPLVIKLNRGRTAATDVLLNWESASCTPADEFVSFAEHFRLFPLSASGVFGDSFNQAYPGDGGGEDDFAYQLHGKVGRVRAHGTYRATATSKDASGATTVSCDSAPVTWSAITG